ncbi:MAG: BrnT family toxin [Lachnospiraceae bacterium]|nr:BrnT family toxin [Lachnospiraceae bacterium]MBR0091570.1 BrnT family toxin [Lachnospiraceae bacterium]
MDRIVFDWDQKKNDANIKKHGVSFEEAKSVFYDGNALVKDDPDHSGEEDRFLILGFSYHAKLLVVCHCWRKQESVIRIISARKATRNETSQYQNR